jgi:hypothetical protein
MQREPRLHILINDFIGGALDRGMPLYVRNLIDGLKEEGFRVSAPRAPAVCRRLPRNLFYVLAVAFEQIVMPILGALKRADVTLYPYNSIAVADLFTRRGRIVVHDLEQLERGLSPSKLYYLVCYRAIKARNAAIFTISRLSRERIAASGLFGSGPILILPNTFYAFERLLAAATPQRAPRTSILLCTGSTANKDLETVVVDYLPKVLARGFAVSILGLHKSDDPARLASLAKFLDGGQLRLCGQLTDAEVAAEYKKHEIVWVHSRREGFGRCVVEGRLAGSRVICTNIPEFTELGDSDVSYYRDPAEFLSTLERLAWAEAPVMPYSGYPYRALLRSAVASGL